MLPLSFRCALVCVDEGVAFFVSVPIGLKGVLFTVCNYRNSGFGCVFFVGFRIEL